MSYKKINRFVDVPSDFDISDPKLTETINLRVTKSLYFLLKKTSELQGVPMSEYSRFLIEWHMRPQMILSGLMFGQYSAEEAGGEIRQIEARLHALLKDISEVGRIQKWALIHVEELDKVKEEIEAVLSGTSITGMQEIVETMEKTDRDFTDVFLEKAKERAKKKKPKK